MELPSPAAVWMDLRRGELRGKEANLLAATVFVAMGLLWVVGLSVLRLTAPGALREWNALWALAAVAFLGAFAVPFPGVTSALFVGLRDPWPLAIAAVAGAAVGGTVGAGLLLLAGQALRRKFERKRARGRIAKRISAVADVLVKKWTYGGIAFLLALPFVPRPLVLYPASLLELRPLALLAVVLLGSIVRYALVMSGVSLIP